MLPPLKPVTAISVEPVRVNPALVPDKVPPILLKSVLLAEARLGTNMQESTTRATTKNLRGIIRRLLAGNGMYKTVWQCGTA
jgi:hypothetical protein